MLKKLLVTMTFLTASTLWAQTEVKTFKGESEASAVFVSGNVDTETVGAKTKNTWNFTENDAAIVFGNYLTTKSAGVETGKSWLAGLRYERVLATDIFSIYVQHQAEHDPFNGVFTQRDSSDLGGKYFFTKTDDLAWFAELGFRHSKIYDGVLTDDVGTANYARGYTEASSKFNESVSGKLWFEYLSNMKDADQNLWNAEASLSVVLTSMFSLKTSYLVNHNEGAVAPLKKDSSTWMTSLVANY